MHNVTKNMLQAKVDYLNKITRNYPEPWTRVNGELVANIGNYHLSGAYGGYCVHQMMNQGGGVTTPICYGHIPKRELFGLLSAFISGYEQNTRDSHIDIAS